MFRVMASRKALPDKPDGKPIIPYKAMSSTAAMARILPLRFFFIVAILLSKK